MRLSQRFVIVALAILAVMPLVAQAAPPNAYFGGSYGQYRFDERGLKENDTIWKAFIGGQFNDWFGLEGAFVNFDRAANQGSSFETDGWSAAAVLSVPLGPNSALYAKGGEYWWDAKSNFAGVSANDKGNDPFWGAGLRFGLTNVLHLRLEYERYKVATFDLNSVSVGLQAAF